MTDGQERRDRARRLAHEILRTMKLPCGYLAEPHDEGYGWVRMPVGHARDCDRVTEVIENSLMEVR